MLVLSNVTMEPSNVRKKKRELPNVTKLQSHMMLVLHNLRMLLSNVRKKIRVLLNAAKVQSNMMLVLPNVIMKDVGTAQCDNGTVKCEEKN